MRSTAGRDHRGALRHYFPDKTQMVLFATDFVVEVVRRRIGEANAAAGELSPRLVRAHLVGRAGAVSLGRGGPQIRCMRKHGYVRIFREMYPPNSFRHFQWVESAVFLVLTGVAVTVAVLLPWGGEAWSSPVVGSRPRARGRTS